LFDKFIQ
jgi:hypothetical protein